MPCGTRSVVEPFQESDMSYLRGKPRGSNNWLPTQVAFGIDCSDPDPENWTTFGSEAEEAKAKGQRIPLTPIPKPEK